MVLVIRPVEKPCTGTPVIYQNHTYCLNDTHDKLLYLEQLAADAISAQQHRRVDSLVAAADQLKKRDTAFYENTATRYYNSGAARYNATQIAQQQTRLRLVDSLALACFNFRRGDTLYTRLTGHPGAPFQAAQARSCGSNTGVLPVGQLNTTPSQQASALDYQSLSESLLLTAEKLKPNTVVITTKFANGGSSNGFGFITGEKDGKIYLVTAGHVLHNQEGLKSIQVQFYKGLKKYLGKEVAWFKNDDLSLLSLTKPSGLQWQSQYADFSPKAYEAVRFIGHNKDWVSPLSGEITKISNNRINFIIGTIWPGTSGAPLLTKKGIIGLILESDPNTSYALSLKRIRDLLSLRYPFLEGSFFESATVSTSSDSPIRPSIAVSQSEQAAWRDAQKSNSLASYQAFLKNYPASIYAAEAQTRLDNLADDAAWVSAELDNTAAAFKQYLEKYPRGLHSEDAKKGLAKLVTNISPNNFTSSASCDPNIMPSDNSSLGYQWRGNRCEGFYRSKVSSASLELITCTIGDFRFKNDPTEVIFLTVPSAGSKKVRIRAKGIPLTLYYRMDAELSGLQTLDWDVFTVLFRNEYSKRAYNIGVLAEVGEDVTTQTFYPVKCNSKLLPKSAEKDSLLLQFMGSARLASFEWQLDKNPAKPLRGTFPDGRPIQLRLSATLPKGLHTLTIIYRVQNSTERVARRFQLQL